MTARPKLINSQWEHVFDRSGDFDRARTHVITDPPYSKKTHDGHNDGQQNCRQDGRTSTSIDFDPITPGEIENFFDVFSAKAFWILIFCDNVSFILWQEMALRRDRVVFAPVVWVKRNAIPRLAGDGPQSSCEYLCVSRPIGEYKCGSLPGYYMTPIGNIGFPGAKPVDLMRALVRDYTKPGDLILDPYAGTGSTLLAAESENRRSIGCEIDPKTYLFASKRIAGGINLPLFEV